VVQLLSQPVGPTVEPFNRP